MRKLFIIGMALIFALTMAGLTQAQEKAKKEEGGSQLAAGQSVAAVKSDNSPAKGKAAGEEHASAKPYMWRMGGLVTAVDPQGKTLSIHQESVHHDWVLKLKLDEKEARELPGLKPGDLVNVWVNGKVITALNKVG